MRTSKNIIIFVALLSVVFLLLTYSISFNEENKLVVLNTPWCSNGFAFAVASGSFASLLVILACELQKYFLLKHQLEDFIYRQLFALYSQITIIHYNIKRQLNEISEPVPSNLIDEIANRGQLCLNSLNSIDFVSFKTHNSIKGVLNQLNGKDGMSIRSFLQNTVFLKMAVNEDKIASLKQKREEMVTANSPKTHLVLQKIMEDSSAVLAFVDKSIRKIDKECKYRYHWRDVKRSIISGEESFVSHDLKSFLQLPTIDFK